MIRLNLSDVNILDCDLKEQTLLCSNQYVSDEEIKNSSLLSTKLLSKKETIMLHKVATYPVKNSMKIEDAIYEVFTMAQNNKGNIVTNVYVMDVRTLQEFVHSTNEVVTSIRRVSKTYLSNFKHKFKASIFLEM